MKLSIKSPTLRSFQALHTWVGLASGLILFIAFYAGAITVFTHELQDWHRSAERSSKADSLVRAQTLLDKVILAHPDSHDMTLRLSSAHPELQWHSEDHSEQRRYRLDAAGQNLIQGADHGSVIQLIYQLHYSAGLPAPWGTYLVGFACVLYGLALVSGLVIHAPTLVKDLFALRTGPNLKRMWQDAHNAIGLLCLPFHVIFAWSGAVLAIGLIMLAPFQYFVYEGKLLTLIEPDLQTAPHMEAAEKTQALLSLTELVQRSQLQVPGLEVEALAFHEAGDVNAQVLVYGLVDQQQLSRRAAVALNGATGEVLGVDQPSNYTPGKRFLNSLTSLHYGNFGGNLLKGVYFALGLAGAFVFYSGNLLYVEARRRHSQSRQLRRARYMARLTLGVCLGCVAGISALFLAGKLLPEGLAQAVYFSVFFACIVWAFLRQPARAGHELLWLCALLTMMIPAVASLTTGLSPWAAVLDGHWPRFWIDATALALAWAFAQMARATLRRGLEGPPNSIWTLRVLPSRNLPSADHP